MNIDQYSAVELGFDKSCVSQNAVEVVTSLQVEGFDGYLVGGCVRDLLMGRKPKDFDVTTNAHPEQVEKLFARARIIGRRFKIVHVPFGWGRKREIIEVATYRAAPNQVTQSRENQTEFGDRLSASSRGRILDDNVYGSIDVDVIRRDFTINALYYDPSEEVVLDFVGGIADAQTKTLKIIGDVNRRFVEDPVRMMRVMRFQAKLDLQVDKSISSAIEKNAVLLTDIPAARLFNEVLKLFHHAAAVKSWLQLRETLLLYYLFPQTVKSINQKGGDKFESFILDAFDNTDKRIEQDKPILTAYLFAVILWQPFRTEFETLIVQGAWRGEAALIASDAIFKRQSNSMVLPVWVKDTVREIWEMQSLLENRKAHSIEKLFDSKCFRAAYDFLCLRHQNGEVSEKIVNWWRKIQHLNGHQRQSMISALRHSSAKTSAKEKTPKSTKTNNTESRTQLIMAQYFLIHPINPQKRLIHQAAEIVRQGGVIAYPTDSSYALGCSIGNKEAMNRIRNIRKVGDGHNFTLVCKDLSEISVYAKVDDDIYRLLKRYTPGAYTFILVATREVPRRLQNPKRRSIGLRVPDFPIAKLLLDELNEPLMSSTLILPGETLPLNDAEQIRSILEHEVDLIIDGGPCDFQPTSVVDLISGVAQVLREGKGDVSAFV